MKVLKIFTDFEEDIAELSDAEAGRLMRAMLRYARTGEEPILSGSERVLWKTSKRNIDKQQEAYMRICEQNRKNVTKRYEPLRTVANRNESYQDKDKDKYAYAFCKYNIDKDFFVDEIGDAKLVYYLEGRYERGHQKIENALEDKMLSEDFKIHVSHYLHKGEVKIDGQYVNALRSDIEDYIVERYCRETIAVEDYFALYDRILDENGIKR